MFVSANRLRRLLWGVFLPPLLLTGAAAVAMPHVSLVLDTSGSMTDNDPRRLAVHLLKVLGWAIGHAGRLDVLHPTDEACGAGSGAAAMHAFDSQDAAGFDAAVERSVRYAGPNRLGPPLARAQTLLDGSDNPELLVLVGDAAGRSRQALQAELDAEIARRVTEAGGQHQDVDVRVSLLWNTRDDLDLHVIAPSGERVFYRNDASRCGGRLDVDRNVGGTTRTPVENIRWARGSAPTGEYRVLVQNFAYKEPGRKPVDFTVEIVNGGRVDRHQGRVSPQGETDGASEITVARFRYDPANDIEPANPDGIAADVDATDQALNPGGEDCPDPEAALQALKARGVPMLTIPVGTQGVALPTSVAPVESLAPLTDMPALTGTVARIARERLGIRDILDGSGTGAISVEIPPHTGQARLLISAEGDLESLSTAPGNPSATSIDLNAGGGTTLAVDHEAGKSAYREVVLHRPQAGTWRFEAPGKGAIGWLLRFERDPEAAWRFEPALPARHPRDLPMQVRGTLHRAGEHGEPPPVEIVANDNGLRLILNDQGRDGDATPGDGTYSVHWTPRESGSVELHFNADTSLPFQGEPATLEVLSWAGLAVPERLDFGMLRSREYAVRDLDLSASELHGEPEIAVTLELTAERFALRLDHDGAMERLPPHSERLVDLTPATAWRLRLRVPFCPEERPHGRIGTLRLTSLAGTEQEQAAEIALFAGSAALPSHLCMLPFLLAALAALSIAFVVYGIVSPARFPRTLGVVLSPEEDLDEGFFQLIRARKGTSAGFYRNARAFITTDFRIGGRRSGAIVALVADHGYVRLQGLPGQTILRRNPEDEWQVITDAEALVQLGAVYRNEAGSLYFQFRSS